MAARNASDSATTKPTKAAKPELVITRVFDAPRPLVFQLWTEREHAMRWWGPKNFTTTVLEMDPRPGGTWRARMRSPEGKEYSQRGIFREIVAPERLVFTFVWEGASSGDDAGHEMVVTVTFADRGGKTEMTFRQGVFKSVQSRNGHVEGWTECFDRLDEYLTSVLGR